MFFYQITEDTMFATWHLRFNFNTAVALSAKNSRRNAE